MGLKIEDRIAMLHRGENPNFVCQVPSGWVVLCDQQYLPGYSILLADPLVPSLNDLPRASRAQFLCDMALVGDALLQVTGAFRINYAVLGNADPILHAHVVPRYTWEPDQFRKNTPWSYSRDVLDGRMFDRERDTVLAQNLAEAIRRLQAQPGS